MKKTGKYLLLAFWFLALGLQAQETNFYATVDKNPVAMGDVFSLKIILENGRGNIVPPDLSDFNVVFGPSRSSNYRIINGQQTSSLVLTYTMRPLSEGNFTIGPAKVVSEGKTFETEPIKLEVVKGSSSNAQQGNNNARGNAQASSPSRDPNLKAELQLSKRDVYLGEQIVATYVILTRYSNIEISETNFPNLPGFWSEDLKSGQASWERDLEIINGVPYRKAVIRRQILFPQRTGEINIAPLTITANVNRSFFNPGTEVKIVGSSPTVNVKPLPAGAPESFDGAVGDFQFKADISRTDVPANESVTLTLTVSGTGNLSLIDEPKISIPKDFEVYDPETKDRISVSATGVSGSRTFQYLIVPRFPGDYEIPAIKFSFFNPRTGNFEVREAGPYKFNISGSAETGVGAGGQRSRSTVEQTASDIRFIISDPELLNIGNHRFYNTAGYFGLLTAPFLFLILILIVRKRKYEQARDVQGTRRKAATKMARRRLKAAEAALKANDTKLFYAEIFKALYGYLSDKMGIPTSMLSRQVIAENLQSRGVDNDTITQLNATLETCEMARFAPMSEVNDRDFFVQTAELIDKIDSKIK